MDEKHRTGTEERTVRGGIAPEPFDQEGDFATEHSLPSSDPRYDPAKAGPSGFRRLRRRART